jgi:hypothetical protein
MPARASQRFKAQEWQGWASPPPRPAAASFGNAASIYEFAVYGRRLGPGALRGGDFDAIGDVVAHTTWPSGTGAHG